MKLIPFVVGCLISVSSFGQIKIEASDAGKHVGETVTVCSKVFTAKGTNTISFLDLGAAYPNSPLSVVIFSKDRKNFKEAPETLYANKSICVSGKVEGFKGKLQIVVTSPEAIQVESSEAH
jgi:aspartyl/asparaginyl-tRNA synthetase